MTAMYEEKAVLYTSACDMDGRWKLSALMETVQNTAHKHHKSVGCDLTNIRQSGYSWMLLKTCFELNRYPRLGESVRITTFIKDPCLKFIPRYYVLTDENGQQLGTVGSLWALTSLTDKKTVLPKEVQLPLPEFSKGEAPIKLMEKPLEKRFDYETEYHHVPRYCDMDINGHVNNVRYWDWLYNILEEEGKTPNTIISAMMTYNCQILPTQRISLKLGLSEDMFSLKGVCGEARCFEVTGKMKR